MLQRLQRGASCRVWCGVQGMWAYTGKPFGWGAGANQGLGEQPLPREPLTSHAWRLKNRGSRHAPTSSFNARQGSRTPEAPEGGQVGG